MQAAGGWQSDTLTEDVDLSYRAQLAGWRFVYKDDVRVPAELPASLRAVEIQQSRWTQGGIQSARKLLPRIWRAPVPAAIKFEATAHLAGHIVHPLTLTMAAALAGPGGYRRRASVSRPPVHVAAVLLATVPFVLFYGSAGWIAGACDSGAASSKRCSSVWGSACPSRSRWRGPARGREPRSPARQNVVSSPSWRIARGSRAGRRFCAWRSPPRSPAPS